MTKRNSTDAIASKQTKKRVTDTKSFIARAIEVHGDLYSYEDSVYVKSTADITITCKKHNNFTQKAIYHLSGNGCQLCYRESKYLTRTEFVERAIVVHGGSYIYDRVDYKDSKSKVEIGCANCLLFFQQTPNSHIAGNGCPYCHKNRVTSESFKVRGKEVHGDTYDYSKALYRGAKIKVIIGCRTCNTEFKQDPNSHLSGRGCPKCANRNRGYSRSDFVAQCRRGGDGTGLLYIIKCHGENEVFYKAGITSYSLRERFTGSKLPYQYDVLYQIRLSASYIYDLEVVMLRLLDGSKYSPLLRFNGHTECFSTIKPIEKLLKELSITEQLQLLA